MNDFLHNLRTGNLKNKDRNRKPYDNNRYRPNDRHYQKDKRKSQQPSAFNDEQFSTLGKILEEIVQNQKHLADVEERRTLAEERKAGALEVIAAYVRTLLPDTVAQPEKNETEPVARAVIEPEAENPAVTNSPAEDPNRRVMEIINEMRAEGDSYDKIARHLQDQTIPTPSGRGTWRGQIVSKLYQNAV